MNEQTRKFTHRNESFRCMHCGKKVEAATKSCRNHCPYCLHSVHLDVFPGDRQANCGGVMQPITIEQNSKKGYQIVHRCLKCGHKSKNILNLTDIVQPDSMETVLEIMRRSSLNKF